jgi:hypothetical protein
MKSENGFACTIEVRRDRVKVSAALSPKSWRVSWLPRATVNMPRSKVDHFE